MKTAIGIVLEALAVLLFAGALGGCAHGPPGPPQPDPCIGSEKARKTMPCQCPGTLDPACQPWILDAKKHTKENAK